MKLFFAAGSGFLLGAMVLHGQTLVDLKSQSKNVDFSAAGATRPVKTGTALPASCGVGELFFLTNAAAGRNSYGCTSANTWTVQGGAQGTGLPDGTGHANQVLSSDGTTAQWVAFGGDAAGAPQNLLVGGLQGRAVIGTQPADGQVLRWNNSAHNWEPGAVSPVANFSKVFTNAVLVTIAGTEHNLGTANLLVSCYDNATPASLLTSSSVTVDPNSFNVVVSFASSRSGFCVVNGLGGSGLTPSVGGDLSGLASNATVRKLQNRPVASATPTDGQVLTWNQTAGQWQGQTVSGGGSGGAQLSTMGVAYVNSTTLTLAVGCTVPAPCNVRFGNTVYTFTSSASAVLQSGAGAAYIYVTSTGTLTVGSNLGIACSGCAAAPNVTGFPANTIPLYIWNAVPGGWNPTGGADFRAYLATKVLAPGLGLTVTDSGTQSTIAVDAATVPGYLTGTATLNFGTVSSGSCSSELTIAVTGGDIGDSVASGWPGSLPANAIGMMRVSAGDTVAVKVCNPTGTATIVPGGVFRATIVRTL